MAFVSPKRAVSIRTIPAMTSEAGQGERNAQGKLRQVGRPGARHGGERRQLPHGAGAQIHEHAERRSNGGADRDERRASCHHLGAREQRLAETLPPVAFVRSSGAPGRLRRRSARRRTRSSGHVEYQQAGKQGEQRDEGRQRPSVLFVDSRSIMIMAFTRSASLRRPCPRTRVSHHSLTASMLESANSTTMTASARLRRRRACRWAAVSTEATKGSMTDAGSGPAFGSARWRWAAR